MHPNTKFCLVWGFTALVAAGTIYGFNEAMNRVAEEVKRDRLAKHQARAAHKAANPDFDSNQQNTTMYDLNLSKIDTGTNGSLVSNTKKKQDQKNNSQNEAETQSEAETYTEHYQPAPTIGPRAGFTHVDFQDPLIGDKSKEKGVQISIPKRMPNRYKDSSGR